MLFIKTFSPSIILFIFCLISFSGNNNILIITQVIIFILSLYIRPDKRIVKTANLLLIPLIIGTIHGIFRYPLYDVFKDAYYFLNPILYLLLGSMIAKRYPWNDSLRAVAIVGTLFSAYLIFHMFGNFGLVTIKDPRLAREALSIMGFSVIPIAAIIILCDKMFFDLSLFRDTRLWIVLLFINLLSLYLSASRTDMIVFIISFFIMLYAKYQHHKYYILLFLFSFIFVLGSIVLSNQKSRLAQVILKAPEEITIRPAENTIEINDNYRGHEAYMTMRTFKRGRFEEKLAGYGFGSTVDMGVYTPLDIRHIPIMHNGYPYILLKVGWIGMVIYIFFGTLLIHLLLRIKHKKNYQYESHLLFFKYFPTALIIGVYITNISITGIFNPESVILWISCGLSLHYKLDFDGRIRNYRKLQHQTNDM